MNGNDSYQCSCGKVFHIAGMNNEYMTDVLEERNHHVEFSNSLAKVCNEYLSKEQEMEKEIKALQKRLREKDAKIANLGKRLEPRPL